MKQKGIIYLSVLKLTNIVKDYLIPFFREVMRIVCFMFSSGKYDNNLIHGQSFDFNLCLYLNNINLAHVEGLKHSEWRPKQRFCGGRTQQDSQR